MPVRAHLFHFTYTLSYILRLYFLVPVIVSNQLRSNLSSAEKTATPELVLFHISYLYISIFSFLIQPLHSYCRYIFTECLRSIWFQFWLNKFFLKAIFSNNSKMADVNQYVVWLYLKLYIEFKFSVINPQMLNKCNLLCNIEIFQKAIYLWNSLYISCLLYYQVVVIQNAVAVLQLGVCW